MTRNPTNTSNFTLGKHSTLSICRQTTLLALNLIKTIITHLSEQNVIQEGVLVVPTQNHGPSAKELHRLQQIFVKYKV